MYIVRKQKGNDIMGDVGESAQNDSRAQQLLDKETMLNIKSLMDENVFDLLDKTETKVIQLQRDNIELLEELSHFY